VPGHVGQRLGDHEGGGRLDRRREQVGRVVAAPVERLLRQLERHHRLDEAVLCAAVQIADNPPALLVGRRGDACARGGELSRAFRVRDRRADELRERSEARLRARRQRPFGRRSRHDAPEMAFDDDRASNRRFDARLARRDADRVDGDRAHEVGVAAHALALNAPFIGWYEFTTTVMVNSYHLPLGAFPTLGVCRSAS
jgi:hypothetical protein